MVTLKKLIVVAAMLTITHVTHPMEGFGKYFTKAYWLPYTCGDALNKKPKVFVDTRRVPFFHQEVKKYTMDTFIRELPAEELKLLFNSKKEVEKEIQRITPKSIFDSGYWLPATNGRRFDIEKLEEIKQKLKR
jgi:hypothetical protein